MGSEKSKPEKLVSTAPPGGAYSTPEMLFQKSLRLEGDVRENIVKNRRKKHAEIVVFRTEKSSVPLLPVVHVLQCFVTRLIASESQGPRSAVAL